MAFLWINSPNFRVGKKYGKRFCWNNCFISWRKYANLIGEYMASVCETMGSESQEKGIEANWLPVMIDGFASQYHWTVSEIMKMPVEQATCLATAMSARVSEKPMANFSPKADRVRNEMLAAIHEVNNGG